MIAKPNFPVAGGIHSRAPVRHRNPCLLQTHDRSKGETPLFMKVACWANEQRRLVSSEEIRQTFGLSLRQTNGVINYLHKSSKVTSYKRTERLENGQQQIWIEVKTIIDLKGGGRGRPFEPLDGDVLLLMRRILNHHPWGEMTLRLVKTCVWEG